jgi:histidyl-tRNA synthetase
MSKPSIPKGTRDFGPQAMVRRQWMFDTLRGVFERHGFVPIQTPSFENLATLTGKYGEEGDQLIFKILNNGDYLAKADEGALASKDSKGLTASISKKALRYDLTVPFARFVVMNRNDLTFPFRRYQIQNVWRGDRPGKGRYQEFTQCDCDIIGSESTLCELDLVQIFDEALTKLGVPGYRIVVNDRRILHALAGSIGVEEGQFQDWTVAVDKLDKVGLEGVGRELAQRGLSEEVQEAMKDLVSLRASLAEGNQWEALARRCHGRSAAEQGLQDMRDLLERAAALGVKPEAIQLDPLLARGLDYYTGAIFEVVVDSAPVGSICGGGRYADLTGIFGWEGMSGVGISFGADRIEDVLNHFDAWPEIVNRGLDVLILRMNDQTLTSELAMAKELREAGLGVEVYPETAKLKKQFKYADDRRAQWVLLQGEEEALTHSFSLKNMADGSQVTIPASEVLAYLLG